MAVEQHSSALSPDDRRARARELRTEGKSLARIADQLGVSVAQVRRDLDLLPKKPARASAQEQQRTVVTETVEEPPADEPDTVPPGTPEDVPPGTGDTVPPAVPSPADVPPALPSPVPPAVPRPVPGTLRHVPVPPVPAGEACPLLPLLIDPRLAAELEFLRALHVPGTPDRDNAWRGLIRSAVLAAAAQARREEHYRQALDVARPTAHGTPCPPPTDGTPGPVPPGTPTLDGTRD